MVPEKSPLDTVPALANQPATTPAVAAIQEPERVAIPAAAPTTESVTYDAILSELMEVIAEKTGYETDELETDFEMEADLGIDTVKQAEIFAELREKYGLERDDTFSFADYDTIEKLAKYLTDAINALGSSTTTQSAPVDPPATVAPAPVVETSTVAPSVPAPAPAAPASGDRPSPETILAELIEVIAEKTGYAPDELETDFELEADLGIDTVKQAEIFSELREKYGLERDDTFSFADYNTIEKLANYLADSVAKLGNGPTQATEIQDTAPVAAPSQEAEDITASPAVEHTEVGATDFDTTEDLLAVISEKTGYETDELELDFELEADLGIDTVKQAEIFAELREKYGLERDDTFNFADYPTIEALIGYLNTRRADAASGTPTDTPETATAAPDTSEVVDVDDSSTVANDEAQTTTEAAESTHAEEPVPQPQGEAALPFKGTFPIRSECTPHSRT